MSSERDGTLLTKVFGFSLSKLRRCFLVFHGSEVNKAPHSLILQPKLQFNAWQYLTEEVIMLTLATQ